MKGKRLTGKQFFYWLGRQDRVRYNGHVMHRKATWPQWAKLAYNVGWAEEHWHIQLIK